MATHQKQQQRQHQQEFSLCDDKFILIIIIIMMIPSTTTTPVGQGIEVRDVDDDDGYYSAPELGGYNLHINEQTQQLSSSSLRDHSFNNTASLPLLRGRFLSAAASSLSSTTSHRGEGILHGLHQHHHNDDDGDMTLLYGVLKDDNTHGGGRDGPKSSPTSITSNQQQNIIIEDGITSTTTTTKKEGDDGGGAAAATDMIRTGSNNNEDSSLYERSIRYKKVFKLHRRLRDNNSNTFYTTLCPNHHHHHPRHNVHNADNKAATTITSSTSTSGMRGITKYSGVVQGCDAKQQQEEDDHHAYKSPLTIPIKQHNTLTGTTAGLSSSSTLPTGIDNIIITSNVILPPHHPTPLAPHDDEVTPAVGNSEVPTVATTTTTNQQQQQHHHQHQHGGSSLLVLSSSPSAAAAVATIPSAINNEFYSPKASSTTTGRRKGRPVGDNDEVYNTKPSTLPPKIIDKNKDSTKVGDINNGDDRSKKKHAAAAAASILSILKTEIFGLNPPCKDDVNTGRRPAFKQVLPDGRRLADLAVMPGRMEYSLTYGFMLCLDATLEELTYMPISCIVGVLGWIFLHRTPSPTQKSDMARIAILAVTTTIFMK
ncbi:hypothetical protein FOZ61_000459 [Perkinsus olseni]|uniref:Uncharacterized protein n=1 Tax=Perkinsus olseni TaxID=32597 RepID=A0A7J6KUR3_PEROL|nr:hypothetical protein FOZ61_000459 [Perkinsus olseni]